MDGGAFFERLFLRRVFIWTLATTAGAALGVTLGFTGGVVVWAATFVVAAAILFVANTPSHDVAFDTAIWAGVFVASSLTGLVLGEFQSRSFGHIAVPRPKSWVVSTTIGAALAPLVPLASWFLGALYSDPLWDAFWFGAAVSVAQWLALRAVGGRWARLWLGAGPASCAIGILASRPLAMAFSALGADPQLSVVELVALSAAWFLPFALVTGLIISTLPRRTPTGDG